MQTREKFGTQAKKMLRIMFEQKTFSATQLFLLCKDILMQDIKKLIDLLFIFEGLGFITRISKKNFIFSGLRGMATRIIEILISNITRMPQDREYWLFSEEYTFEYRKYPLRQSVYIGLFYQEVLGLIFSSQTRTVSREAIEKLLEQLAYYFQAKDINLMLIFNEMASIMTSLNLLDKRNTPDIKSEAYETYQWIGPDIMSLYSLDQFHPYLLDLKFLLEQKITLNYEKEINYFNAQFRETHNSEFEQFPEDLKIVQDTSIKQPISLFPIAAYAILKGRNLTYFMKKLSIIIGRQNHSKNLKYQWDVDFVLDSTNKVSKQHAMIQYNFELESFVIRCLSNRKSIVVDQTVLTNKDKGVLLKHRSFIQIGRKTLMFYLSKNENEIKENNTQQKQQIEME